MAEPHPNLHGAAANRPHLYGYRCSRPVLHLSLPHPMTRYLNPLRTAAAAAAATACPDRSAWKIDLGELAAGKYTIRVFDLSAEYGSVVSEDDKDFTVN